jgi:hypothetical protein
MKKLLSFILLVSLCSLLPARADECCQNSEATVQQRLRDIDLNIALKQYEQIRTEVAKAELQLVLIQTEIETGTEASNAASAEQMKKRRDILAVRAEQIREHILELSKPVTVAAK